MSKKGFTLIELLAVLVILGILLSISITSVNKIRRKQANENYLNSISSILTGAKMYISDNQRLLDNFNQECYGTSNNDCIHLELETLIQKGYVDIDLKNDNNMLLVYDDLNLDGKISASEKSSKRVAIVRKCPSSDKLYYLYHDRRVEVNMAGFTKSIPYNDCGCAEQALSGSKSSKLCVGYDGTDSERSSYQTVINQAAQKAN